ncbi:hypothetical protein LEP48_02325 [Isoptericola sp. NEAU-Y5]|uniref:Secreted protein n=1 Tax=Isoptericola luteus TaxID=2879484 RepID=A0ABS7ZAX9_9MICO|nr:hypothetical protein [Isoptericola sp. NEAU-Y5]MCA5892185.1 hypothetical protein [Isoptericola sp. NEAU-Y5]
MSRLRAAAPAVLLALLAAGCATSEPGGSDATSSAETSAAPSPTAATPSASPSSSPSIEEDPPVPTDPEPGEPYRGLPDGVEGTMSSPAGAGWSAEPGLLYVVTFGSSSCPRVAAGEAVWDDAGEAVVVTVQDPPADAICTMDYSPTTSFTAVPDDVEEGAPVMVRLGDDGEVEVQPRSQDGANGPVAWLGS